MDATINPPVPNTPSVIPVRPTTTPGILPGGTPVHPAAASSPASTPVVKTPAPTVIKPSVRKTRTFFHLSRIGEYLQAWGGIAFFLALGATLWRTDAHFTLWFFQGWAPTSIAALSYGQWTIPILFTIGQMYFFVGPKKLRALRETRAIAAANPDHEPSYRAYSKFRKKVVRHFAAFLIVSIVNIGTSAQGMYEWAAGRTINMFGGITLPQPGRPLQVLCFGLGVLLAFGAEKAFKAAWDEYRES